MPRIETYTADGRLKTDSGAADLAGHTGDASDAHDASAISVLDSAGYFVGTEVETALAELGADADTAQLGGGAYRRSIIEGDQIWKYSEMDGGANIAGIDGGLAPLNSGTAAAVTEWPTVAPPETNHPGILRMGTGSTSTGRSTLSGFGLNSSAVPGLVFGAGKVRVGWLIKTDASLSDGTQRYRLRAGFNNVLTDAEGTNALYFRYRDDVNSGKWEIVARVNNVESAADSGFTAVAINTWYMLEIEVNAAGTSAEFFINGTSVGTRTPPAGTTNGPVAPFVGIYKAIGNTARFLYADMYYLTMGVTR